ncbi:MAG: hypothetical protein SFU56_18120 [Capsulimonadales bacterium]|nr:hypothetical protein [Capsulimonadales bacterium]
MTQDFERTRQDIAGRGVTITSWYESATRRYRANAPAYLHLFNDSDSPDARNTGTTRESAVRAVRDRLTHCLEQQNRKNR